MRTKLFKTLFNGYLKIGDIYGRQYLDELEKRHKRTMKNLQSGFEIDRENIKQDFDKIMR